METQSSVQSNFILITLVVQQMLLVTAVDIKTPVTA